MKNMLKTGDRILFISDVHLGAHVGAFDEDLENTLIDIVNFCDKFHFQIVILGDLYDFWMEYPGNIPDAGKRVMKRFENFHQKNPSTLYITGNHDCWTGRFHSNIGFDIESEYRILKTSKHKILVHHGDGLRHSSLGLSRSWLNKLLRNTLFTRLYKTALPPKVGYELMKRFSKIMRKLDHAPSDTRTLDDWSKKLLKQTDLDAVISGHDHVGRLQTHHYKTYLNTGAFFKERKIGLYNRSKLNFVKWNSKIMLQISDKRRIFI